MAEINKENKSPKEEKAQAAASAALGPAPEKDDPHPGHHELNAPKAKTKGETAFDFSLYTGLNYFANLAISVVIADMFLHGKGNLNKFFVKTRSTFNTALSAIMPAKRAKEWSDIAVKTATLPLGGHIMMVPIKLLEDRKKRIVYWINSKFFPEEYEDRGITIKPVSEMKDSELPELVETPTESSWPSVIKRRLLGWGAVIATNSILDRGIHIGDKSFNTFVEDNASKAMSNIGIKPHSTLDNYVRLTATDSYLTVITSFITRITNGGYGKKAKHQQELLKAAAEKAAAAPIVQPDVEEKRESTIKKIVDMGPAASYSQRVSVEPQAAGMPDL